MTLRTEIVHFQDERDLQKKLKPYEIHKIVAVIPYHGSGEPRCCGQSITAAVLVIYEKL